MNETEMLVKSKLRDYDDNDNLIPITDFYKNKLWNDCIYKLNRYEK